MLAFSSSVSVEEVANATFEDLTPARLSSTVPIVFRGLIRDWPLVKAGQQSASHGADYIRQWSNGKPVQAFEAPHEVQGRFFYNEQLDGFNFKPKNTTLDRVLDEILASINDEQAPCSYLGSTSIDHIMPGFRQHNDVPALANAPLVSIWAGAQSRIAAHFDVPDNLACCAVGKRRFTLFPPEQLENLYIGPLDFTPAGPPASLVDFYQPDFARFPKFKLALQHCSIVELGPGDAIFIPSMWWHHVEGLAGFNVLVNYWWRQVPHFMGTPMDALNHAILSIRDLPKAQRENWQNMFEKYVFSPMDTDHIPTHRKGILDPLDEQRARQLRATLINKLNR
ncbi:cupin-like domain-containing protein [Aliiglaciecola litoralis]|uniref:Cupin-like domain-containing protein n=1 Tax=Aliiglaciecola litoralis TaxID=582857 RepID=A0ABP3X3U5_9ALTE